LKNEQALKRLAELQRFFQRISLKTRSHSRLRRRYCIFYWQ